VSERRRFPFLLMSNAQGDTLLRAYLPLTLTIRGLSHRASGLLDTGADVNVLPFPLGIALGAVWEEQSSLAGLSGNLANYPARAILVTAAIETFEPVQLVSAWTAAEHVPLILGHINFFDEFNVCFYRSLRAFEITRKATE
jgi:hypothetical protein